MSDTIRICGHATDDVITLWWSREFWYDFSPSWLKFLSWCDFVCLGVILYHLSVILFDSMVLFYILVQSTASWYDFLRFDRQFRLSVILSDLVSFHILV